MFESLSYRPQTLKMVLLSNSSTAKRLATNTVSVARKRTLTAHRPWAPSIGARLLEGVDSEGVKKTQKTNKHFTINPCVARRYSYLSRCIKQSQLVVLFLDFDVDCKTNKSLGSYINAYRIPENHLTLLGLYGRPIKKKKRRNWTPILWLYNLAVDRLRMKNMTSRSV